MDISVKSEQPDTLSNRPTFCPSSTGFTLLEIMVALSIIAIALVGIYQLHIRTLSMSIDAKFYSVAPLLAQKKLAELEQLPLREVSNDTGNYGDDFPGYTYQIVIGNVDTNLLGTFAEQLKTINIVIGFNDDEYTYGLRTYRLYQE